MARHNLALVIVLCLTLTLVSCGQSPESPAGNNGQNHGEAMDSSFAHTNRLIGETSPYLLQHAHNPVDWYPWGDEALQKAREEDKPIFLSIGYSACHWCHVMERESFENDDIAQVLNEHFIAIKVDREERPDLDEIYMSAVQVLSGSGGWPMSVWLTPDLKPFFGGTYFPPESKYGRPGFKELLLRVAELWQTRREDIEEDAGRLSAEVAKMGALTAEGGKAPELEVFNQAVVQLQSRYDARLGGFGTAPKFPHSLDIELLLQHYVLSGDAQSAEAARGSLEAMCQGGIYDHLGGGFARYSTDAGWQVPHFEKMLYDNALIAKCLVDAHLVFGSEGKVDFRFYAEQTLDWVLRDMTSAEGVFFSAYDADSEGVEGKFYVWTPGEIEAVLGKQDAELFCEVYTVTEEGNFEEKNTLHISKPLAETAHEHGMERAKLATFLAGARAKLLEKRAERVPPGLDDKAIVAWNALMIRTLAHAGVVFERPDYLQAARSAADFIVARFGRGEGRLHRTFRAGEARNPAAADDYGLLLEALIELYEASFELRYLREARGLASVLLRDFHDVENGGFYYAAADVENLYLRPKKAMDNVLPSGNSAALHALFRLGRLLDDSALLDIVDSSLVAYSDALARFGHAFPVLLQIVEARHRPREIAVVGTSGEAATEALLAVVRRQAPGSSVLAFLPASGDERAAALELIPWLEGRGLVEGRPAVYICEDFKCLAPLTDPAAVRAALQRQP